MNKVLETTKVVVEQARDVKINHVKLEEFCSQTLPSDILNWNRLPSFSNDFLKCLNWQDRIPFPFIVNSLNFCYWPEPRWSMSYHRDTFTGALGLIHSFQRALEEKIPLLESAYLKNISKEDLMRVFRGKNTIPLFDKRLEILHEVGTILDERYNGKFLHLVEEAHNDALSLVNLLTSYFPSYYDASLYQGKTVFFHKRAQLAVADLYDLCKGADFEQIQCIQQLSAFADYKIPHVLRSLEILQYSQQLAEKVDNRQELSNGSLEEIEIRASQIWTIEYMKHQLQSKIPDITSKDIDTWLWIKGKQLPLSTMFPHRTRTIAY